MKIILFVFLLGFIFQLSSQTQNILIINNDYFQKKEVDELIKFFGIKNKKLKNIELRVFSNNIDEKWDSEAMVKHRKKKKTLKRYETYFDCERISDFFKGKEPSQHGYLYTHRNPSDHDFVKNGKKIELQKGYMKTFAEDLTNEVLEASRDKKQVIIYLAVKDIKSKYQFIPSKIENPGEEFLSVFKNSDGRNIKEDINNIEFIPNMKPQIDITDEETVLNFKLKSNFFNNVPKNTTSLKLKMRLMDKDGCITDFSEDFPISMDVSTVSKPIDVSEVPKLEFPDCSKYESLIVKSYIEDHCKYIYVDDDPTRSAFWQIYSAESQGGFFAIYLSNSLEYVNYKIEMLEEGSSTWELYKEGVAEQQSDRDVPDFNKYVLALNDYGVNNMYRISFANSTDELRTRIGEFSVPQIIQFSSCE